MSQDSGNILNMTFQSLTSQEHMTDHIQKYNGTFSTVLKLLLSQNINHQRNVVRAFDMETDNLYDLIDKLWDVLQVKLADLD